MAGRGGSKILTLGGKGSSLSSSSIYSIATSQSQLRLDSSVIDRLSSQNPSFTKQCKIPIPDYFTPLEIRASLVVLLNKILYLANSTKIRALLANSISEALNSNIETLGLIDATEEETVVVEKSAFDVYGVCVVLDYEVAALSVIADAVAALSCEAVKGDIVDFNSIDTGDASLHKEEIGVASDMKILLNGSKLLGKMKSGAISEIPTIHGKLREMVKLVHSMIRDQLKAPKSGTGRAVRTTVISLAAALQDVGESSLLRVNMNLDAIGIEDLKNYMRIIYEKNCPTDNDLGNAFELVSELLTKDDYGRFVHEVNVLLGIVWRIVVWEGITAFVVLEGGDLMSTKDVEGNGGNEMVLKKGDKKKKKAILGKGTSVIVQLFKDRLQGNLGDSCTSLEVLEKLAEDLMLYFDPKNQGFDGLIEKVKEIVESNESRRLPKLPKGTRDFAKEQMTIREKAFSIITEVFKRHGATALDTPVFEMRETLMGKYGEDSKLIYDLADQGGELCSLRYDLTVPFARYVAMNGLTSFKRYQIAKVYRRDNPSKGRYREFYQCDCDIAGQYEEMGPDFEIVRILTELLDELDIGDYEIKLNHRKLLDGMLEICGVPPEKFRTICSSIDKLDKQSFDQVKKEMVEEKGLNVETADRIGVFVKEKGHPGELLLKLKQTGSEFLENASSKCALDELEILFEALDRSRCIDKVVFDLSLARGLDYYTGVIFEAVFKGTTQVGSIAAGGRYDNLIGMFGTKQVPSVGVSLGIERVFAIMEQHQKDQNQMTRPTETQVLVSILGDKSKLYLAAEVVSELWDAKIKAEYVVSTRFSKHMDRVKESRIPWMVLVGDKEVEKGIVKIKNIETAQEDEVPRAAFVRELKRRLSL